MEVVGNGIDDDCDGFTDEATVVGPTTQPPNSGIAGANFLYCERNTLPAGRVVAIGSWWVTAGVPLVHSLYADVAGCRRACSRKPSLGPPRRR